MLRPMSRFHHDLEENRWHCVEIKATKNAGLQMNPLHSRAQQQQQRVATKKTKNSPRQINKARRGGEDRHGYHKARRIGENQPRFHKGRREEEGRHGYQKVRQEPEDRHVYHRAQQGDDRYEYRKAQQGGENWHGYQRAQREVEDRHVYRRTRQEDDRYGYHKVQRKREHEHEDRHVYHRTQQGDDRYGYYKVQREQEHKHGYSKAQREGEDCRGYDKAQQQNKDRHGYYRGQREEENTHEFKYRKRKTASKSTNTVHQKALLEEKECHGLKIKQTKNTSRIVNGLHQKAHHTKNSLQSTYKQHKSDDDTIALVGLLKSCAKDKDLQQGSILHTDIITRDLLQNNVFVGSALVNMYAKCGAIEKAQEVFDKLPVHNVVSWTTLIAGYAQLGKIDEALSCFELMQCKGFSPDAFTFACILRACTGAKAFDKGKAIHSLIMREYPSMEENTHVGTVLVDMYSKCGALEEAQEAFDKLPVQDVVSWTALIAGYAQHEQADEALFNFEQMQHEGLFPDAFTFACVLKACGSIRAAHKGQSIHAQTVRYGVLENNMFIGTALVDMYARCGMLAEAQDSFNNLQVRDVVAWSTLIDGYAQHGLSDEALECFEQMQRDGFTPDVLTLTCILKACGRMGAPNKNEEIYARIIREQTPDIHIGTMLVDMYAKCGALEKAKEVFSKLEARDVVLWTALIAGYTLHGHEEEALNSFEQMKSEGLHPDAVTFSSILKACGNIGAVLKGQELHAEIVRHGLLKDSTNVGTALVDMYANLGMFTEAQDVFDKLTVQDLVVWSVLIAGYAQLGKDKFVFSLFNKMIEEGKRPDPITFIPILNICSHKGLVDKGQFYFERISKDFGMLPIIEHHTCIIDLFGRAGHLDKAVAMIEDMSLCANLTLWHTFLGACQKWGDTKLGSWAFTHALQLNETNASPYVALRNIYSDAGHMDIGGGVEGQHTRTNLVV